MKKTLLAVALAVAAFGANAQYTAFANTDYTRATGNSWYSQYENRFGVAMATKEWGTFDILAVQTITKTNATNNSLGAEVGWGTSTKVDQFDLNGRVGFGGISSDWYYSVQGEAKYALDPSVQPVLQYRFRDGFEAAYVAQNRFLIGADFSLAKDVSARLGYTYTVMKGPDLNGLSATVNFGF